MAGQPLAFGPYELDPSGVLLRDGMPVQLGRRALRLLECLLRRRGQVVTKAELIDAAWPGEAVEESNLSVQIAQLRKTLGSDRIRTVERVGYQMLAETLPGRTLATPALQLLPFRGPGASDIADDLITALARFGTLRVLAGPGVADYVLEGGVRHDGGAHTIVLRLVETRTGAYYWVERFDLAGTHDAAVGRIASIVEGQIELAEMQAVRRDRPESEDAPDLLRRAQLLVRTELPESCAAAVALLEQALALDPDNIRYLAAMCGVLGYSVTMGWRLPSVTRDRLFACASHGLRQPARDAESLACLAFGIFRSDDPAWGYGLMQSAIELNRNSPGPLTLAGNAAMHWGTLAEAESYFRRAMALDQRSPNRGNAIAGIGRIRMIEGRFQAALAWARRASYANPHYGGAHWTLVAANAHLGRAEDSAAAFDRYTVLHPDVTISRIKAGQPSRARLGSTIEGLDRAGMAHG